MVEVLLNISMGKASSASYNINYHIVWCPKFRKPILTGKLKTFVEEQLETITGLRLFKRFPELENELWRDVIWSPSYYVGTAGHVYAEVI